MGSQRYLALGVEDICWGRKGGEQAWKGAKKKIELEIV
jgi:hypothetical protein